MPKFLSIQIPEPCGEKPENMSPTANGSYCHSCKKEVIDFTAMTDESLAIYFRKHTGNTCGMFHPDQLNTEIQLPKKELPWLKYFFTIAIPAFLISLKVSAQNKISQHSITLSDHKFHAGKDIQIPLLPFVFTGKLIDQFGKPIEAASVTIANTRRGAITDKNGDFAIPTAPGDESILLAGEDIVTKKIPVRMEETGIISVERVIDDLPGVQVVSFNRGMTLGMVSTTKFYYFKTKPPVKQNEMNDINIFPNPVRSNAELNISWKEKVQTDQRIEVFAADGRLIQQETIHVVSGKLSSASVTLKKTRPGLYIIMIIDMKTGKKMSKEIIVQ